MALTQAELDRIYEDFHDDGIFAAESLTVLSEAGQLVPMLESPAPKRLAAAIAKRRAQGKPVRVIVLKARRVRVSTYTAARFWRDTTHRSGQHTMVIAQDEVTAANVFATYSLFDKTYQPFRGVIEKPRRTNDSSQGLEYANGSWIRFHTAKTTTIGRSFALRRVHFSEFAFYGDGARALMSAVMAAVPKDPDTEVIVESTANGIGNEFHLMWQRAVAGESEWIPFFFAWWEHPEYFLPLDVEPAKFKASLDDDELDLIRKHGLTYQQLHWRRRKIADDLNGDEETFKQEYPSNPEEAFLASGRPRFDLKAVERMPVVRDAIQGGLEMEERGGRKSLIFLPRERGELTLFRRPQENREYVGGVDSAEGIDVNAVGGKTKGQANPDFAAAHIFDRDTGEQVARLRARLTPAEFGWQLFLLGIYYYWAQLVVEANGPGLAAIDALLGHGYPPGLLYHRLQTPDQDPTVRADLVGWKMTQVTRPQLISLLDAAIRDGSLLIHDPETIAEMRTFVIKADGRAEHQYGCHDDLVIAAGLGLVGIQQMPRKPSDKPRPAGYGEPLSYRDLNKVRTRHDRTEDERGKLLKLL